MKKRGETPDGPQSGATDEFGVAVHKVRVKPDHSKMPKKKELILFGFRKKSISL